MSQNPNDGNYNPYGPNPSNPNYPPVPDTVYGGPPQPPSGPNPGYNPPPSGPNPYASPPSEAGVNTPNSGYGPYGNPYAPPPPPGAGPGAGPYANPPTPMPPSSGPNLYNPYDPTVLSQPPNSGVGYPAYPLPPTPLPTPQPKRGRGMTIAILVIVVILIVGGSIFGVVANTNNQATMHANATATTQANVQATAHSQATAAAIANTYPFSNKLALNDPLADNSKGVNWDTSQSSGCAFSGSAYHVTDSSKNTYNACAANKTDYSNFTFEVEMMIKQGDSNADGGLIFRADSANNKFYRLYVDQQGGYGLLVSVDTTGTGGNARNLKDGTAPQFNTGLGQTNTLGIVARGDQIALYINHQLVATITDSTYTHGQIGVTAATLSGSETEVIYTNAKVWQL
mgnify:CR=1 FL=1